MIRFALSVTAAEVALTLAAALLLTFSDPDDACCSEEDLRAIGLECRSFSTDRGRRLQGMFFETRAELAGSGHSLHVRRWLEARRADYDLIRQKEEGNVRGAAAGQFVLLDEPYEGERGFFARDSRPGRTRAELLRLRGAEILMVRVLPDLRDAGQARAAAEEGERLARRVLERLLLKLGWR